MPKICLTVLRNVLRSVLEWAEIISELLPSSKCTENCLNMLRMVFLNPSLLILSLKLNLMLSLRLSLGFSLRYS